MVSTSDARDAIARRVVASSAGANSSLDWIADSIFFAASSLDAFFSMATRFGPRCRFGFDDTGPEKSKMTSNCAQTSFPDLLVLGDQSFLVLVAVTFRFEFLSVLLESPSGVHNMRVKIAVSLVGSMDDEVNGCCVKRCNPIGVSGYGKLRQTGLYELDGNSQDIVPHQSAVAASLSLLDLVGPKQRVTPIQMSTRW